MRLPIKPLNEKGNSKKRYYAKELKHNNKKISKYEDNKGMKNDIAPILIDALIKVGEKRYSI